jgi:hypothetical protein
MTGGRAGRGAGGRGFLPSRDGFAFTNAWPPSPAVTVRTPVGRVGVGNSAAGLCGGMVFAALDYWHAGVPPPVERPGPGSPLHRYVVRRLIASWDIPAGVARYYQWMNLPDGDRAVLAHGRRVGTQRGVSWRTLAAAWPRIRARLDAGHPAALGVVTVASANPARLRHNHQVLAFGYTRAGSQVTLRVYDPNSGPDDRVGIRFDVSSPTRATLFEHNLNLGWPVRGFFGVRYAPATPPAAPPPAPPAAPPAPPPPRPEPVHDQG